MMKCVTIKAFGQVDDVVNVVDDFPKPKLEAGSGKMLVRVHACSTSPGDWRTLSGSVDVFRNPGFPYIPSQDVCGIVEEIDGECKFKVGDCIVGTWRGTPLGGMAEYALVDPKLAVIKPDNISVVEGAALGNSAVNAMLAMRDAHVKRGDRVLVIGAGGGVGTAFVQLARNAGASFIASVSTEEALMKFLGVDQNINYREQCWWDIPEFKSNKFDVVVDLAEGDNAWKRCKSVLKTGSKGGRFLAVCLMTLDAEVHRLHEFVRWMVSVFSRQLWTSVCRSILPRYYTFFGAPRGDSLSELFKLVEEGRVKVVLDPSSPFPFTTEGARAAYRLQASNHAHGKIVVQIFSDEENENQKSGLSKHAPEKPATTEQS